MPISRPRAGRPDIDANVAYWNACTESVLDRFQALRERDVSLRKLILATRALAAFTRRATTTWPKSLAARAAAIHDHPEWAPWADEPRPIPPTPRRFLTPENVRGLLDGPPSRWPWRPDAAPEIAKAVEAGCGIELLASGRWYRWDPASGVPVPRKAPAPMLHPLFEKMHAAFANSGAERAIYAALTPPDPEPLPPSPRTSIDARRAYRRATAKLKRHAIAMRRGDYRKRENAEGIIAEAMEQFRRFWFSMWVGHVADLAGKREKALTFAQRLRAESVTHLDELFAPTAAPPQRKRRSKRMTTQRGKRG